MLCETCKMVFSIFGTTESVNPWLCTCDKKGLKLSKQLQFSAGRFVGTAFNKSWQGAPKGKKIRFRPTKKSQ